MSRHQIDYETLAQDAMRGLVRTVLQRVAKSGLPGDHHFYISFHTRGAGVIVSKRLLERYPDEMTIVLQNKFSDLKAFEDRFEVTLWFDSIPERLAIPFTAIKVFFDPSVPFGHQFEAAEAHAGSGPHAVASPSHAERDGASGSSPDRRQDDRRQDDRPLSIAPGTPSPAPRGRPAARGDMGKSEPGKGETGKPAAKGPVPVAPLPQTAPASLAKPQPAKMPPRSADIGAKKGASDGAPGPVDKTAPVPPPAPPSTSAPAEQSDGTEEQQPSKVVALDAFRKKN